MWMYTDVCLWWSELPAQRQEREAATVYSNRREIKTNTKRQGRALYVMRSTAERKIRSRRNVTFRNLTAHAGWKGLKRHQILMTHGGVCMLFFFFSTLVGRRLDGVKEPRGAASHGWHIFRLIRITVLLHGERDSCVWCYDWLKRSGSARSDPEMTRYDDTTFLSHDPAPSDWWADRLSDFPKGGQTLSTW